MSSANQTEAPQISAYDAGVEVISVLPQPTYYSLGALVGASEQFTVEEDTDILAEVEQRIARYAETNPEHGSVSEDTFVLGVFTKVFDRRNNPERRG